MSLSTVFLFPPLFAFPLPFFFVYTVIRKWKSVKSAEGRSGDPRGGGSRAAPRVQTGQIWALSQRNPMWLAVGTKHKQTKPPKGRGMDRVCAGDAPAPTQKKQKTQASPSLPLAERSTAASGTAWPVSFPTNFPPPELGLVSSSLRSVVWLAGDFFSPRARTSTPAQGPPVDCEERNTSANEPLANQEIPCQYGWGKKPRDVIARHSSLSPLSVTALLESKDTPSYRRGRRQTRARSSFIITDRQGISHSWTPHRFWISVAKSSCYTSLRFYVYHLARKVCSGWWWTPLFRCKKQMPWQDISSKMHTELTIECDLKMRDRSIVRMPDHTLRFQRLNSATHEPFTYFVKYVTHHFGEINK